MEWVELRSREVWLQTCTSSLESSIFGSAILGVTGKVKYFGARVLRQYPLECLIQFLCSSNNNIGKITKMVDFVSSLENYLGVLGVLIFISSHLWIGHPWFQRKILEWFASLREMDLQEVVDALSTLPGVGPKVAACIALFIGSASCHSC